MALFGLIYLWFATIFCGQIERCELESHQGRGPLIRMNKDTKNLYQKRGVWYFSRMTRGRRVTINLETYDLAEALQKKKHLEGHEELTMSGTLTDEIDRYMEVVRAKASEATWPKIQSFLNRIPKELGNVYVLNVSPADARRYIEALRPAMSSESLRTYIGHARAMFAWSVKQGFLRSNPFKDIEVPRKLHRPRIQWVKPWESDKLLAACERQDLKFILFCGFHAGLRRNEIVHARPEWFDFDHKMMNIKIVTPEAAGKRGLDVFKPKGRSERSIPLSPGFQEFLSEYINSEWDYCIGQGIRRRRNAYRYDFRRMFETFMLVQGFSWCSIHTMRHSFISTLYSSGKVMTSHISEWTGDEERTLDGHYKHLLPRADLMAEGLRGILRG